MEKIKKRLLKVNTSKKFILAIILVVLCTFMFPNYSHAFITESILNKAATGLIMVFVDNINRSMALIFKIDTMGDTVMDGGGKLKEIWEEEKNGDDGEAGFLKKFSDFMEKTGDSIDEIQYTWFDLLLSPDDIFSGKVKIANAPGSAQTAPPWSAC